MLNPRIYTPDELRALARPTPSESRHPVRAGRPAGRSSGTSGGTILAVLGRIVRRGGVRRPAPGTT